jgi:hypothetical protein
MTTASVGDPTPTNSRSLALLVMTNQVGRRALVMTAGFGYCPHKQTPRSSAEADDLVMTSMEEIEGMS